MILVKKLKFFHLLCLSKIDRKQWTNPFGKILILRFSYTVVFIVFKGFFFI